MYVCMYEICMYKDLFNTSLICEHYLEQRHAGDPREFIPTCQSGQVSSSGPRQRYQWQVVAFRGT